MHDKIIQCNFQAFARKLIETKKSV